MLGPPRGGPRFPGARPTFALRACARILSGRALTCSGNSTVAGFIEGTAAQYSPAAEGNRDLSTSVLQVRDRLLVQPVIGEIDPARLRQLTQELLYEIRRRRARVVVIDMTGVPALDAGAVKDLVQAAATVRLMGAKAIITGLSPEIAKELAPFGADLRAVTVAADLQGALEDAERLLEGSLLRPAIC